MKCPTCGKWLKKGQAICPYCGALADAGSSQPTIRQSGLQPPAFPSATPPAVPTKPTVFEDIRPAKVEEIDDEIGERREAWPDAESPLGMPAPPISTRQPLPPTTARPKPPGWVRLVAPIFYVLIFLALQFWMRNSRRESADRTPKVHATALCAGSCDNPKSVFSKKEDIQVVFLSTWTGEKDGHRFEIVWHSPDNKNLPGTPEFGPSTSDDADFVVTARLPIGPSLPIGLWRTEISLDGRRAAAMSFQLVE